MTTTFISCFIFAVVQCSSAANILILSFPLFSHINGPANVAELLRDQGHNITIAIPPRMQTSLANRGLNLLLYHSLGEFDVNAAVGKVGLDVLLHGKPPHSFSDIFRKSSDKILRDQQFLEDIRACKFDLIILPPVLTTRMLTIIPYKLDIPFMFMGIYMRFSSNPILPSVVPHKFLGFTDQMTFRQRFVNTFTEFSMYFDGPFAYPNSVGIYAPEKPYISLMDLEAKTLLWILIQDGIFDYNCPAMPNIKRLSPLLPLHPKPLADKFQIFMDTAEDGVVIVSFGSIVKSMPGDLMDKFIAAFERTKYKFVIRYPISNSTDSNKMLFANWLPQYELLTHKNTKLFITHCGSNGQQEAIHAGIPMIGFPMFAEQAHNAARIVRKGFGLRLDLRTFTVKELVSAIEEVITNPEYKVRTKKASAIMQAAMVPPVEEAAFWINHILTFGGDHLKPPGQDMPLWKYLGLDILAVCLLVWHMFLFIVIRVLRLCYNCLCGEKEKMKNE